MSRMLAVSLSDEDFQLLEDYLADEAKMTKTDFVRLCVESYLSGTITFNKGKLVDSKLINGEVVIA